MYFIHIAVAIHYKIYVLKLKGYSPEVTYSLRTLSSTSNVWIGQPFTSLNCEITHQSMFVDEKIPSFIKIASLSNRQIYFNSAPSDQQSLPKIHFLLSLGTQKQSVRQEDGGDTTTTTEKINAIHHHL